MHINYRDITSRITEKPQWFDENAVPRYDQFTPDQVADIYCNEAALVLIACQNCGTRFKVAFSGSQTDVWMNMVRSEEYYKLKTKEEKMAYLETAPKWPIATSILGLHYGDPPNSGCCPSGPTMNCNDLKVLEYWRKDYKISYDWIRYPEFEVILPDHPEWEI